MIITSATETRIGKHTFMEKGRDYSPRFIRDRKEHPENDSVTISAEARERLMIAKESPLVRALYRLYPGITGLAREIENAWDGERAVRVNKIRAQLREGIYDPDMILSATGSAS